MTVVPESEFLGPVQMTIRRLLIGLAVLIVGAGLLSAWLAQRLIAANGGAQSRLAKALGSDLKGKLSLLLYGIGFAAAFFQPWLAIALYIAVALMWLIPDRRIEDVESRD